MDTPRLPHFERYAPKWVRPITKTEKKWLAEAYELHPLTIDCLAYDVQFTADYLLFLKVFHRTEEDSPKNQVWRALRGLGKHKLLVRKEKEGKGQPRWRDRLKGFFPSDRKSKNTVTIR